jgi:hypothetical protein
VLTHISQMKKILVNTLRIVVVKPTEKLMILRRREKLR